MARDLLVKTVETNTKRRSRRAPGEIPYPIKYSNQMADLLVLFLLFTFLLAYSILVIFGIINFWPTTLEV